MTGDVVNLRQARKTRDRKARQKQAAENRVTFGRSKQDRREAEAKAAIEQRRLDGHRRRDEADTPDDSGVS